MTVCCDCKHVFPAADRCPNCNSGVLRDAQPNPRTSGGHLTKAGDRSDAC